MRFVVQLFQLFATRLNAIRKDDFGVKVDPADDHLAGLVLGHVSDSIVFVAFDGQLLKRGERQKGEQMAAGEGRDESLFGIDAVWIAEILGRGGSIQDGAVFEGPGMVARVVLVAEIEAVPFPREIGFVF